MDVTANSGPARSTVDRWLPCAISGVVTCLFFIDVCGWWFACGCRSLWAGADAACNVHNATGAHCPFCVRGIAGYGFVFAAVWAPQVACSLTTGWSRHRRTLACLVLFPAGMIALGLILGWYDGYWTKPA